MKKTLSILLVLALMLSLGVTALAANDLRPAGPYSLTLYKYRLDLVSTHSPALADATGETMTVPSDAVPLGGVTFTLTLVDASGNTIETTPGTPDYQVSQVTAAADGKAEWTGITTAGRYHVVETAVDGATSAPLDFYIDLPMTKPDGSGWLTDVVLYPKNELVQGAVIFTKTGEDTDATALANATFKLQKETATAGTYADYPSTADVITRTTDEVGKFAITGLPSGNYQFIETGAPTGYTPDTTPVTFSITASGTVTTTGTGAETVYTTDGTVATATLQNYKEPAIDKTIDLDASNTVAVGDDVTFTIIVDVPTDIYRYTEFYITDSLQSAQLSAAKNVVVKGVNGTTETPLNGESDTEYMLVNDTTHKTITVTFINKDGDGESYDSGALYSGTTRTYEKIKVTFDATILNLNTTITNQATLEYNNDHGTNTNKTTDLDPDDPNNPTVNEATIVIDKYKTGDNDEKLAGAEFAVYATREAAVADKANNFANGYVPKNDQDETLATNNLGAMTIDDLAFSGTSATYYLVETKAPEGYKLLTDPVEVTITRSGTEGSYTYTVTAPIANDPSSYIDPDTGEITLPKTGGVGTLIFTAIGLAFVLGGGYMISKKRREG